jgi:hypothetical protein
MDVWLWRGWAGSNGVGPAAPLILSLTIRWRPNSRSKRITCETSAGFFFAAITISAKYRRPRFRVLDKGRFAHHLPGKATIVCINAMTNDPAINELQEQNRRLRTLILSLAGALSRKIAVKTEMSRPLSSADAEQLVREAKECFRCARTPELKSEIAEGLEVAGRELMSRAVEIETDLQRAKRKK